MTDQSESIDMYGMGIMSSEYARSLKRRTFSSRIASIDSIAELHDTVTAPEAITDMQLKMLNSAWMDATSRYPFYSRIQASHSLPAVFSSLEEFYKKMPVLTKNDLRASASEILETSGSERILLTGGSTGEPVRLPTSTYERKRRYASTYYFRRNVGLEPFDPYLHLWGHAHLLGVGWRRRAKAFKRRLLDSYVGAVRLDGSSIDTHVLQRAVDLLRNRQVKYVIGYAGALLALARYVSGMGLRPAFPTLRCVVLTAESSTPEDRSIIKEALGCPVVQEYGAAETGVIAHTGLTPESQFRVNWTELLLEVNAVDAALVTTIGDREFPLFRYEIGDEVEGPVSYRGSVLWFTSVLGRTVDYGRVPLKDGREYSMRASVFVQLFRGLESVETVQFDDSGGMLRLFYYSPRQLDPSVIQDVIVKELLSEVPRVDLERVSVESVAKPQTTVAGKRQLRRR